MVGRFTDEEIWVFGEIIGRLASEIELAARAKLAAKLSRIDHAPGPLIDRLASDQAIEVAGPVLRYSERIDVRTLLKNANSGASNICSPSRSVVRYPEPVTDVLVVRGNAEVAQSVATNEGAQLSESGLPQPHQALRERPPRSHREPRAEAGYPAPPVPAADCQSLGERDAEKAGARAARHRPIPSIHRRRVIASLHSKFDRIAALTTQPEGRSSSTGSASCRRTASRIRQRAETSKKPSSDFTLLCSLPSDVVERALVARAANSCSSSPRPIDFPGTRPRRCYFSARPTSRSPQP